MGVPIDIASPGHGEVDTLAVPLGQPLGELPGELGKRLREVTATGEFRGDRGETLVLRGTDGLGAPRVVLAGLGKHLDADAFRTAAAVTAQALGRVGGTLGWQLDESAPIPLAEQARALVEGTILGGYTPGRWKTQDTDTRPRAVERIVVLAPDSADLRAVAERAALLAERTNRARDLANMPPNELNPHTLGEHAQALAGELDHVKVEVLGLRELDKLEMGALSAVGRGSRNEPRLIVLRYDPPNASTDVHLGIVGKAITFDSGGLSLKPAARMEDMKGDMAGGAGTLHGIGAIAALKLPVRVTAVLAAAENLPGGDAFRPGDILRAANGKTIEITNTDAEGRLVLADALWYARREGATHVIDLATLTGAMELALGDLYAGFFANDDAWSDRIVAAGERSGDLVWPFPMHERYRRYVDSAFADMKNSSTLRQGSPVLAAKFLEEFAGEGPWAHVDMAGPGFLERSRGDYYRVPGGTGYGVRLVAELASSLA
jgi:leucyl aminopeptidase